MVHYCYSALLTLVTSLVYITLLARHLSLLTDSCSVTSDCCQNSSYLVSREGAGRTCWGGWLLQARLVVTEGSLEAQVTWIERGHWGVGVGLHWDGAMAGVGVQGREGGEEGEGRGWMSSCFFRLM